MSCSRLAVFRNDPRPAYPAIDESDLKLYEYVKDYRPTSLFSMTARSIWRCARSCIAISPPGPWKPGGPFVQNAVKELLDAAEAKGHMDVRKDLATPLPVLVIAQMMGVPTADRPHVRDLAEKLLYIGRGEYDRMRPHRGHARDDRLRLAHWLTSA